ncbi:hypothetical protein D3C80_2137870 [compost metagenome]
MAARLTVPIKQSGPLGGAVFLPVLESSLQCVNILIVIFDQVSGENVVRASELFDSHRTKRMCYA